MLTELSIFAQGMWVAYLLVMIYHFMKSDRTDGRLHAAVMCIWVIANCFDFALHAIPVLRNTYCLGIYSILNLLCVPGAAFIALKQTQIYRIHRWIVCLHCSPYLLMTAIYLCWPSDIIFLVANVYSLIYGIIIFFITQSKIHRYHLRMRESYSNEENLHLGWMNSVMWAFLGILLSWTLHKYMDGPLSSILYMLTVAILWTYIYHRIGEHKQRMTNEELHLDENGDEIEETPENEPVMDAEVNQELHAKLREVVVEGKLYLDPNLTLVQLAAAMGTNRTYLSRFFNNDLNQTFYDYINGLRTDNAEKLLIERQDKLEVIALEAGFSSLATLRRAIQRRHGCTLTEYRARVLSAGAQN